MKVIALEWRRESRQNMSVVSPWCHLTDKTRLCFLGYQHFASMKSHRKYPRAKLIQLKLMADAIVAEFKQAPLKVTEVPCALTNFAS